MTTGHENNLNEAQIKNDWQTGGFSFGIWIDPPGQEWNNFVHTEDELLMLIEGKMELRIEQKIFYPKIGEESLIPANRNHSVKNIGNTTNRWFYGYKRLK